MPVETPYINLAIPVHYKLNSYRPLFESSYVPRYEQRLVKLRVGAEDELSHQILNTSTRVEKPSRKENQTKTAKGLNSEKTAVEADTAKTATEATKVIDLVPGKHLSEPFEYPPMHIFVSQTRFI